MNARTGTGAEESEFEDAYCLNRDRSEDQVEDNDGSKGQSKGNYIDNDNGPMEEALGAREQGQGKRSRLVYETEQQQQQQEQQLETEAVIENQWEHDEDQLELMRQYGLPSNFFGGSGGKRQMSGTESIVSVGPSPAKAGTNESDGGEEGGETNFISEVVATRMEKRRKWRPILSEHTLEIESFACLEDFRSHLGMAVTHLKWDEEDEQGDGEGTEAEGVREGESRNEQAPSQGREERRQDQDEAQAQDHDQGTSDGESESRQENEQPIVIPEQEGGEGVKVEATAEASLLVDRSARVLKKFHRQRYDLFHRFDEGIQIDEEGWWSVTPELIAAHTALILGQNYHLSHTAHHHHSSSSSSVSNKSLMSPPTGLVWDAFAGVGGNAIQFALKGAQHVIATDTNWERLVDASHNAEIYEVRQYIDYIQADALSMTRFWRTGQVRSQSARAISAGKGLHQQSTPLSPSPPFQAVFFSPPWGGPAYTQQPTYDLLQMLPISLSALLAMARVLTHEIILYLPRTTSLPQLANHLLPADALRLEWHYLGDRLKVLIVHVYCESTSPGP